MSGFELIQMHGINTCKGISKSSYVCSGCAILYVCRNRRELIIDDIRKRIYLIVARNRKCNRLDIFIPIHICGATQLFQRIGTIRQRAACIIQRLCTKPDTGSGFILIRVFAVQYITTCR